ncbi:MAG: GGDEF domain-containing protein, partial [Woeseiaceae bacterium]
LARTDPLTGLANGRTFRERLDHDIALSTRLGASLTVAYIDLDDFKRVNDTEGHSAGDALLVHLGQAMKGQTRRSDTAARLGGDEFALILPDTDFAAACADMQQLARRLDTSAECRDRSVTFSIGAVVIDAPGAVAADVIEAADRLMYLAKHGGKNAIAIGRYSDAALNDVQVYPSGSVFDDAA